MIKASRFTLLAAAIGLSTAQVAAAETVTLQWTANAEPDISRYVIHMGTTSGVYTQQVNAGNVTSYTFPNLDGTRPWYFALQAVNSAGIGSSLSPEVVRFPRSPKPVDFNNDGGADIVWRHKDGYLSVWHMNGVSVGSSTLLNPSSVADPNWQIVATKDMNGDGRPDLTWQHRAMGWIATWFMNGANLSGDTLLNPSRVEDTRWKIVAAADMDADDQTDLIWQHDTGIIAAWLMQGTQLRESVLLNPSSVPAGTWRIVAAGDINGDGHPDLIWQHPDGWLSTWLMQRTNMINSLLLVPGQVGGGNVWKIKGMADINQDGRQDLIWQHDAGHLSVWFMDGATMTAAVSLNPSSVPANTWSIVGPK